MFDVSVVQKELPSLMTEGLWSAASEVALKDALCMAMGMSEGFHEGAVAE